MASNYEMKVTEVKKAADINSKLMELNKTAPIHELSTSVRRGVNMYDDKGAIRKLSTEDVLNLSPTNTTTEHRFSVGGTSLNDLEYQKAMNELLAPRESFDILFPRIHKAVKWDKEKVHDMNMRLIDQPVTEDIATAVFRWSRFLFFEADSIVKPDCILIDKKDEELANAMSFYFDFVGNEVNIPYKYWSDIAPFLMSETRRFYFGPWETWIDFNQSGIDWDLIEKKTN